MTCTCPPALTEVGAQAATCTAHKVQPGHTPPTCAWCPDPASEQIKTGTVHYPDGSHRAHYAWVCEPCAIEARREHDWSVAQ